MARRPRRRARRSGPRARTRSRPLGSSRSSAGRPVSGSDPEATPLLQAHVGAHKPAWPRREGELEHDMRVRAHQPATPAAECEFEQVGALTPRPRTGALHPCQERPASTLIASIGLAAALSPRRAPPPSAKSGPLPGDDHLPGRSPHDPVDAQPVVELDVPHDGVRAWTEISIDDHRLVAVYEAKPTLNCQNSVALGASPNSDDQLRPGCRADPAVGRHLDYLLKRLDRGRRRRSVHAIDGHADSRAG